ncbi:hypothetical protein BKA70DRAFT_1266470 [Coprinopsis sp. MPI-PUGE-AT-0042]|nr:hypothetical protein BKA70DRAFT_1266470 [Coprinopsis sp. MPI-PUGE-AT-0042]
MFFIGSRKRDRPAPRPREPSPPPLLHNWSSPAVPDSAWCSQSFLLGSGMLIIQKNTHKVVLVYEKAKKYYFLPKGRKDTGESLEQAALREAYEESGYRPNFMSHFTPNHAPIPPHERDSFYRSHSEAIYITTMSWAPRKRLNGEIDHGGEYLTHWYLGEISEDATRQTGTGMPDELNYEAQLLSIEQARQCIGGIQRLILEYGWLVYQNKLEIEAEVLARASEDKNSGPTQDLEVR